MNIHILKLYSMKNTVVLLLISLAIVGCSSTNYVTMSVLEPAPVTVPSYIKKVGIVDRSLPSDENEQQDKIDQVLSIEGGNLDIEGSQEALRGVDDELSGNNRFTEVSLLKDVDLRSPGMGIFPAPLSWDVVEKICNENHVDALFVLEFYDTDTDISYSSQPVTINGPMGVKIPAVEHYAHMHTLVKTGWRVYDPIGRMILDEFPMQESIDKSGKGINPAAALSAMIGRKDAVKQVSYTVGQNYAYRILPYSIRVSRKYYVRGTDNFKIAKRRAQTGDWEGAAQLWERETENPKAKVAGRANYNMAIINEINGNLDAAIQWAKKAYSDYKIKLALEYVRILEDRERRNERLREQTEE